MVVTDYVVQYLGIHFPFLPVINDFHLCLSCLHTRTYTQEIRNTLGNIPLEWYEDYPHMGYDITGKPRPKPVMGDEVGVAKNQRKIFMSLN